MNLIRPRCKGIGWGSLDIVKDIEFADDITLFADSKTDIEDIGDIAMEATTECGTGINDKTEVIIYGTIPNADRTEQIRIGPCTCKDLRKPSPFLGIMFSNNMTGKAHQHIRQNKPIQSIRNI